MKNFMLFVITVFLSVSCDGQKNETEKLDTKKNEKHIVNEPKGTWKVDKEFDENGNLIRYDSIYSWSSNSKLNNLASMDRDSLLQSFKSQFFTSFSRFEDQGFENVFSQDSLFSDRFFNDEFFESDFGNDFMNVDKLRQQMMERQRAFLEKYQSEFIKSENEN